MVKKSSSRTKTKQQKPMPKERKKLGCKIREILIGVGKSLEKVKNRFVKISPHKTFRRTYREDYKRELEVPGILTHIFKTFGALLKNWKLFLPMLVIMVVVNAVLIGVMSASTWSQYESTLDEASLQVAGGDIGAVGKAGLLLLSTITTGGLANDSNEVKTAFSIILLLVVWLVTIFLLRHLFAGHKVKLRDGFYNALTPLISTLVVLVIAIVQCIPIFLLVIAYSAAVQTDFLTTPFYALVFFIFAALMILISGYLLSSSLIAMVAVSAPGLYPLKAIGTASELMMGRRTRFILRLVALVIALAIMWVVVMLPLILFDMGMKKFEWAQGIPFMPVCMVAMVVWTEMYITAYLYIYYRWMLGYEEK